MASTRAAPVHAPKGVRADLPIYLLSFIVFLLIAFAGFGVMGAAEFGWSVAAAGPVFVGVVFGQWLRRHIDQERFRRAVLVLLLFTGLSLVWRAL